MPLDMQSLIDINSDGGTLVTPRPPAPAPRMTGTPGSGGFVRQSDVIRNALTGITSGVAASAAEQNATSGGLTGGGGYGGGGGGFPGGGGGSVVDGGGADAGGGAAAGDTSLEGLSEADLAATIAAIEAQFGMTREQLLADQSSVGRTYRQMVLQAQRLREQNVQAAQQGAAERGIARSGILAQDLTNVEQTAAEQIAILQAQQAAEQAAIQGQIAGLDQQQSAAVADATATNADVTLDLETLRQLIGAGIA